MDKLFVPYEIAKALKAKGFDEPCLAYYDGSGMFNLWYGRQGKDVRMLVANYPNLRNSRIKSSKSSAPTYDQALNWLRERWIWVSVNLCYYDGVHYLPKIATANPLIELDGGDDYYECMNRTLLHAIELIKTKKDVL